MPKDRRGNKKSTIFPKLTLPIRRPPIPHINTAPESRTSAVLHTASTPYPAAREAELFAAYAPTSPPISSFLASICFPG